MKIWMFLLTAVLIIANFLAIYFFEQHIERWFRFASTFIFLLIYLFKYFSRYKILVIFILFALCDGLLVFYEIPEIKNFIYLTRISAYLLTILMVASSLSKLSLNLFSIIVSGFIVVIDVYLLKEMAEILPDNEQNFIFLTLFYLLGIASLVLAATALSYMNRYSSKKGFLLVIVAFGSILSDMFFYNSHYLGFYEFYYLDRLVNILAMAALLLFSRELVKNSDDFKSFNLKKF